MEVVEGRGVRYFQYLGCVLAPRIQIQGTWCTHERVSLVHVDVDVADAATLTQLVIEVDRLHEYTRAHVVQERVLVTARCSRKEASDTRIGARS